LVLPFLTSLFMREFLKGRAEVVELDD